MEPSLKGFRFLLKTYLRLGNQTKVSGVLVKLMKRLGVSWGFVQSGFYGLLFLDDLPNWTFQRAMVLNRGLIKH